AEDGIRDFHVTGVQTCALPILPSQQRFEGDDLARMDLKDGLVEHSELTAVKSGPQVELELEASNGPLMHGWVEQFGAVSSHGLRATESGLGIAQGSLGALR